MFDLYIMYIFIYIYIYIYIYILTLAKINQACLKNAE